MTPFNRIAHDIGIAKGFARPEPNPRPLSDAEIMRTRFARWLRRCHKAEMSLPAIIARIHDEPADSDWLPGEDEPKRDRS